jgi:hypothetical protein
MVSPRLGQRIAAELLEERLRDHEGDHPLRNDPHRRDSGDVAAFGHRFRPAARIEIHRT